VFDVLQFFPELDDAHLRLWLASGVRAMLWLAVGLMIASSARRLTLRVLATEGDAQRGMIFSRATYYVVMGLTATSVLKELGFDLSVLLGAAGIVTVAVGFASQTSASNLISGLFLIAERPVGIGDVIQVGVTTGEVLAIDLLSVKLRSFDNLFVRIPNETLVKSEVRPLTRFPVRRLDLEIGVAYKADLEKVREVLFDLADRNPLCLDEPKPLFLLEGFGDSAIQLLFAPWATRENYLELKNTVQLDIKRRFEEEGIEIPFPQRTFHAGTGAAPIPVRVEETPTEGDR
jgi:small-conductance mechanosensitive channel